MVRSGLTTQQSTGLQTRIESLQQQNDVFGRKVMQLGDQLASVEAERDKLRDDVGSLHQQLDAAAKASLDLTRNRDALRSKAAALSSVGRELAAKLETAVRAAGSRAEG